MGSRLRQLRRLRLMNQGELAEASGVGRATISRIERGETEAQGRTLRRLADALDVAPEELVEDPKAQVVSIKDLEYEQALRRVLETGAAKRGISEVLAEFELEVRRRADERRGGAA